MALLGSRAEHGDALGGKAEGLRIMILMEACFAVVSTGCPRF